MSYPLTTYRVTYRPFTFSDMTTTLVETGTSPEDVTKRFEAQYPNWQVVSVEEAE